MTQPGSPAYGAKRVGSSHQGLKRYVTTGKRNRRSLHYAPRISYFALLATSTCAALRRESRMQTLNATGLDRKSGRDLRFLFPVLTYRFNP